MITWGHMIWIFFPIPVLCLFLLSMPLPRKIDKIGTNLVRKIFFIEVSVGRAKFYLIWVFVWMSLLILGFASRSIQLGFNSGNAPCSGTSCPLHLGETMWYRRAVRYRAERNWWLSLFTFVLWLLVYRIYSLKERVVTMRHDLETKQRLSGSSEKSD